MNTERTRRSDERGVNTGLRVGDAERDEVVSTLHEHFAQGRLSREELDERVGAALGARTVGDLRKVTADLPAPPVRVPHWPDSRPGRYGLPMMGFAHRRRHRPPFGLIIPALVLAAILTGGWVIFPLLGFAVVSLIVRCAHARW